MQILAHTYYGYYCPCNHFEFPGPTILISDNSNIIESVSITEIHTHSLTHIHTPVYVVKAA